jgi:YD repeat-containing protein
MTLANVVNHQTLGATYGTGRLTETFQPLASGIEQSFHIASKWPGSKPLVITIPITGLRAHGSGKVIELRGPNKVVRSTYSDLRVVDADGTLVPATMRAASRGHQISITIFDRVARYPLTVDPTWAQIASLSDGTTEDSFGESVSISGTTALVGAPGHTVGSNASQGAAFVYTLSGGMWTQTAELTASNGMASAEFGVGVALSGNLAFVGAPAGLTSSNGAVYEFTFSGGTWTQTTEITASNGNSNDQFGSALAFSGSTLAVGAINADSEDGAVYIFTVSGSTWTQQTELSEINSASTFGNSIALNGTTLIIGDEGDNAAYFYSGSGSSWTDEQVLQDGFGFGTSVSLSGSSLLVGASFFTLGFDHYAGAAFVFTLSGTTWTEEAELTGPLDGTTGLTENFGDAVAISGTTAIVEAPNGNDGDDSDQPGTAYIFSESGPTWTQTATYSYPTGGAVGESSLAYSGSFAFSGQFQGSGDSVVLIFAPNQVVQPQGTTPTTDSTGGGSNSEPCQCADVPATEGVGDPVDSATGDLYQTSTDLSLPGAGIPLEFTRTYDAQQAQAEQAAASSVPQLGYGWSNNLAMNVAYNTTTEIATVTEENGAQVTFSPYASGTSPAWCTAATNFCATSPRIESTLNQNGGGTWTYIRNAGAPTTFAFSSGGVLTSIVDQQGATLTSSAYSPSGGQTACPISNACVEWTSSASGRELVLATNGSGQLTSVFDANSALVANFSFSGTGCSTWSTGPTDLCSVADPGGLTDSFSYDSANTTKSFDYDMLTDTPPGASASTTNIYNTEGQVTQQTNPSGDVTTFAYAGTNSSFLGGTTTVTNYPLGTGIGEPEDVTVDAYSSNVLVGVITGDGTSSASQEIVTRDPVSLLPTSVENGDGASSSSTYQTYSDTGGTQTSSGNLLTTTDAAGNTTAYEYNTFNQAWCSVDAADYANGKNCPSSAPTSPPSPGSADPNLAATPSTSTTPRTN